MPLPDPSGHVALMLCESTLHMLVEEGVLTKERALELIDGLAELADESEIGGGAVRPAGRPRKDRVRTAVDLIDSIRESFAAKADITNRPAKAVRKRKATNRTEPKKD